MNCESCERPKKSRMTALSAFGLINFCGVIPSTLIGQQFANRSHTPAAEMIDVIERAFAAAKIDQILDGTDEIFVRENAFAKIDIYTKLLIDLVAPNTTEVVFLRIEEKPLEQRASIRHRRRIARAKLPVNIF